MPRMPDQGGSRVGWVREIRKKGEKGGKRNGGTT